MTAAKAMLQDIAILTGGQVISEEVDLSLETADVSRCSGQARKVVVTKDETTIVEGAGDSDAIAGRVAQIPCRDRTAIRLRPREAAGRLAKLAGGVAVIKAGAATEVELKERKHRHRGRRPQRARLPSRRASSPVVAWLCCRLHRRWTTSACRVTRPRAPTSSAWRCRPAGLDRVQHIGLGRRCRRERSPARPPAPAERRDRGEYGDLLGPALPTR